MKRVISVVAVLAFVLSAANILAQETVKEPTATAVVVKEQPSTTVGGLPNHIWTDLLASSFFLVLLVLGVIFGWKGVDFAMRKIDFEEELKKGNIAVGIVVASIVVGLCYATSQVLSAIIH